MGVLAKYDDPHDDNSHDKTFEDERGRQYYGRVLNLHTEAFRVQIFRYTSGLHIRRAPLEDMRFFPAWLETALAQ